MNNYNINPLEAKKELLGSKIFLFCGICFFIFAIVSAFEVGFQDLCPTIFFIIFGFIFIFIVYKRNLKRTLVINDNGIQYYINNDLNFSTNWHDIKTICPDNIIYDTAYGIIFTFKGKSLNKSISPLTKTQLDEIFSEISSYAINYDIKILK
jgi:hypothetical protein